MDAHAAPRSLGGVTSRGSSWRHCSVGARQAGLESAMAADFPPPREADSSASPFAGQLWPGRQAAAAADASADVDQLLVCLASAAQHRVKPLEAQLSHVEKENEEMRGRVRAAAPRQEPRLIRCARPPVAGEGARGGGGADAVRVQSAARGGSRGARRLRGTSPAPVAAAGRGRGRRGRAAARWVHAAPRTLRNGHCSRVLPADGRVAGRVTRAGAPPSNRDCPSARGGLSPRAGAGGAARAGKGGVAAAAGIQGPM